MAFVHRVRPRYAEVDAQGVVFNAHWLTYFDEACTRWFEAMGFDPSESFFHEFDVMIVKAVLEWQGPRGSTTSSTSRSTVPGSGRSRSTCGTRRLSKAVGRAWARSPT